MRSDPPPATNWKWRPWSGNGLKALLGTVAEEAGLPPFAVYGEGDALPRLPNAAAALLEEDALLLRDGSGQVVSAQPGELAGLVDIACAEHAGDEAVPFRLVIYCEPALQGVAQEAMASLNGRDVELRLLEQGVMPQLAAESMSGGAVNLLQGEFRRRDDRARRLRGVATGLLVVALLFPGYLAMDGWRAQREYQALAGIVDARLRQMMPDAGASADLRGRVQAPASLLPICPPRPTATGFCGCCSPWNAPAAAAPDCST